MLSAPGILGSEEAERIYRASGQRGCGKGRVRSGRLKSLERVNAFPHRRWLE